MNTNSFPASAQTELREVSLSECPALLDLKRTLRTHFTKVWPTRYVAVCPPAYAAVRPYGDLVPDAHDEASLCRDLRRALVVYLPNDYEASLAVLAKCDAVPRVHKDVGLLSSGAYWSWTLPAPKGELPRSVWVLCNEVQAALKENHMFLDEPMLPIVWVAGQKVVVSDWRPTAEVLEQGRKGMAIAAQRPSETDPATREAAAAKALRYGERPWLFMRYELRSGYGRLAVNWAPVESN